MVMSEFLRFDMHAERPRGAAARSREEPPAGMGPGPYSQLAEICARYRPEASILVVSPWPKGGASE